MKNESLLNTSGGSGNMKKSTLAGVIFGTLLFAGVSVANATYIRGAVSVSELTSLGDQGTQYGIGNIVDQSGLSASYSNGENFESFTSSTTHDWRPADNEWWAPYRSRKASILFDLGGEFEVGKVAFWNEDWGGIKRLKIFATDEFGNITQRLGRFRPSNNSYEDDYLADVFCFRRMAQTQYLRFDLIGSRLRSPDLDPARGRVRTISVGEVAFSVTEPVPEPATVLLFGAGLAGLIGLRRKSLQS